MNGYHSTYTYIAARKICFEIHIAYKYNYYTKRTNPSAHMHINFDVTLITGMGKYDYHLVACLNNSKNFTEFLSDPKAQQLLPAYPGRQSTQLIGKLYSGKHPSSKLSIPEDCT